LYKGIQLHFLKVVLFIGFFLIGTSAYSQSADPYDPSSPNYVGNKAKIKRPKWSASVSSTLFGTQDPASELGLFYDGVLGYFFNKNLRGDVTLSYSHTSDFNASQPSRWQFEDISLRLLRPSIWKSKNSKWSSTLISRLDLPTSQTSQNSGQFGRLNFSFQTVTRWKKFTFAFVPRLGLSWHEYETQDRDGVLKNSPLSGALSVSARYSLTKKIGFVVATGLTTLIDYDFNNQNVQVVSGSIQYLVNKKVFVSGGFRWRDRVVTNNSLFDDDASLMSLSIGYTL